MACLRVLSKGLVKEYHRPCFLNRLCFRSPKSFSSFKVACHVDRRYTKRFLSINFPRLCLSNRNDFYDNLMDSPASQGNGFWLQRRSTHAVLENDSCFQSTIFSAKVLEDCVDNQCRWSISTPTKQDIFQASVKDLSSFICHQAPTMGREDFRKCCTYIAEHLPTFTDDDILQITMSMYTLRFQGGNTSTIWEVIDKELLARYYQFSNNPSKDDFFTRVTDVIFWLNFLDKSFFVEKYLSKSISSQSLRYPHGIQIMFYASCTSRHWRSKMDVRHLTYFLDEIKGKCQLNTFLVAIECFSLIHFVRRMVSAPKTIHVPRELQHFLIATALQNNNDDVLKSVTQFFYSCAVRRIPKNFHALLDKISGSGPLTNFIVVYYILHIMSNCRIKHDKFIANLDSFDDIDQADPKVISSMFLNLYGDLGPKDVAHLAKRVAHFFENGDICSTSEGLLLKIFVTLMDSGINLFHLWELTMQGDVIVPNYYNKLNSYHGGMNGLHLVADDCIEVNCPQYRGSRLSDALRMQLYLENNNSSNNIDKNHLFYTIFQHLQDMSMGLVLMTHVLPGFSCPGVADLILCLDRNRVFKKPTHVSNISPWRVKKLPKPRLDCTYFVVWASPSHWPPYYVKLKDRTLKKLGYVSLMIQPETWSLPNECIDHELHSFFYKYSKTKRESDLYV